MTTPFTPAEIEAIRNGDVTDSARVIAMHARWLATLDALRAELERVREHVAVKEADAQAAWAKCAELCRGDKSFEDSIKTGFALAAERDSLRTQLASARADLRDYGRHNEGCSGAFPPHRCKCGWDEVSAALAAAGGGGETSDGR